MAELTGEVALSVVTRPSAAALGLAARLKTGTVGVMIGRGLGIAGNALMTVLVARLLTPEDFGAFVLLQSFVAVTSRFALAGMSQTSVRFIAGSLGRDEPALAGEVLRRTLHIAAGATAIAASLAAGCLAFAGDHFHPELDLLRLAPWLICSLVLVAWLQLVGECLRGYHEMHRASLMAGPLGGALANALFPLVFFAATRVSAPSLLLAIQVHVASMAVALPVGLLSLVQRLPPITRLSNPPQSLQSRTLLAVGLPLMVNEILAVVMVQADLWLAGAFAPEGVGLYGAARKLMVLVALPAQLATLTIMSSIPDLHARGELQRLEAMVRRAATLSALPAALAVLVLALSPGRILTAVLGPPYGAAAIPLILLGLGQVVLAAAGPAGQALALTGSHRTVMGVSVIAALVLATAGALAALGFGIAGLAAVSSAVVAAQALTLLLLSRRQLGIWTHASFSSS